MAATIERKLKATFQPTRLVVRDDSSRHAGHAGARPGGETHFHVVLVSARFEGVPRIERQRRVHECLADELAGPVHALSLSLRTPDEDNRLKNNGQP